MFGNLISSLGAFANIKHSVRAAFGAYAVKQEVTISASDGVYTGKRRYQTSEDYTAIGKVNVCIDTPLDDPRGLNKTLIGENGYVSAELFAAKMRNIGGVPRGALLEMALDPTEFMRRDSHVALLVALLSTYYVLEYKENKVDSSLRAYNDGHVKADLLDLIAGTVDNDDWRPVDDIDAQPWEQTTAEVPSEHPVINCSNMSTKEITIIVMHLMGRRRTTQLAFDLEMPVLCEHVRIAGKRYVYSYMPDLTSITAKEVKTALNKYVLVQRLEAQFEAALAMYHQVALTPMPDQAEGYVWLLRQRDLVLPAYDSFRGAYTILTREQPYGIDAAPLNTWKWWLECGLATVVPASMYNGFSLWGRYLVEGKFYHSDAEIDHVGHLEFADNPGAAYYSYASLITGHETYVAVPPGFGLRYAPWDDDIGINIPVTLIDVTLSGYDIVSGDDGDSLVVKHLPPPCSAAHVLGRMPREGSFSALSDRFKVNFTKVQDGWVLPDMDTAWAFAMVTRWAGFNAEMEYRGKRKLANWAPNATSIAARPFFVDGIDVETVRVNSIKPRDRVFFELPQMGLGKCSWDIEVAKSDRYTVVSLDKSAPIKAIGGFYSSKGRTDTLLVEPANTMYYMPVYIKAASPAVVRQTGFLVVGPHATGVPKEPVSLSVPPADPDIVVDQPPLAEPSI